MSDIKKDKKKNNIDNENMDYAYRKALEEIYVPGMDVFDAMEEAEKAVEEIMDDW